MSRTNAGFHIPAFILTPDIRVKLQTKFPLPSGFNRLVFNPKNELGLLYRPSFDETPRETFIWNGIEVEFIDYWPHDVNNNPIEKIRACYSKFLYGGECEVYDITISIYSLPLKTIKGMELWNYLPEKIQNKLESINNERKENGEEPEVGRKRDPMFAHLPRELNCCTEGCEGKLPYISPTILIEKAKEKGLTPEQYAETWKCNRCVPAAKRGRAANPNSPWFGKTKQLKCSCGNTLIQAPSLTYKLAENLRTSYDEYVLNWKCKDCRGTVTTSTTTRRGRKCDPNSPWFGKAKELVCACGKVQPQHASITAKQAEASGKSFDDYVSGWQCMSCRPCGDKRKRKNKAPIINSNSINSSESKDSKDSVIIPKEIACISCSKVVKIVASNIIGKAGILGISVEELLKNYRCRKCGGKLKKNQGKESVDEQV